MDKKQIVEEVQVGYQVYSGTYPVVIFDLTKVAKPIKDISFNLTEFVKEYNLDVEKTSWLFYQTSEAGFAGYYLRTAYRSEANGQIRWQSRSTGDYYILPVLIEALLSRCSSTPSLSGTIKTPIIASLIDRRLHNPRNSRPLKDFL